MAFFSVPAVASRTTFAPQNDPVVLTLETGGVLTDQIVTIPVRVVADE